MTGCDEDTVRTASVCAGLRDGFVVDEIVSKAPCANECGYPPTPDEVVI